ncbi:MAG TPA: adenylosuccinate synthase [Candidatus Coprenecus stercoravium]|uniref:Adenylosuccinate synthetase n=1 Tax=Candidatus Coprenecus stercoravium TaxID=2840735 RepID=A0A9D2K8T2_9BACT|nr:adenylosuccinate synthase [Candidatus Coprenecus stercoravium]
MKNNKAKVDVVLGLQWGDEGKGKIVDVLADRYNIIARFQGGPNAGHSIQYGDKSFVLHSVPSGIFREGTDNIIGNGVVLDPIIFQKECTDLEKTGVPVRNRIRISKKAHLITPTHRIIDAASEAAKGKSKIGSTLKGIGPAYMDKTGRNGLRVGDILAPDFQTRFDNLKKKHIAFLKQFDYTYDPDMDVEKWMSAVEYLKTFDLVDGEYYINSRLDAGASVLAEGAQGSMLDVDFGSYPFVTSSTTICSGACLGLGVAPGSIGSVYGIFKAYCTRVGSGPFPTELFDATGEELRTKGHEFGATTGRSRRTGWLDMVALKYAVMLNGVTELIMMKADVMDTFDTIKIATGYIVDGQRQDSVPYDTYAEITPVYKEFKGWKADLSKIRDEKDLPAEFKEYISFIEQETGVPVTVISLGPDRAETIFRK